MQELTSGQRLRVDGARPVVLRVELGAKAERFVHHALLLVSGKAGDPPEEIVFSGHASAVNGAVELLPGGTTYRLHLSRLQHRADRLILVAWISEPERRLARCFEDVDRLAVVVGESPDQTTAQFAPDLIPIRRDAALILAEVYVKGDIWRIKADGFGFLGGLPSMANRLGMGSSAVQSLQSSAPARNLGAGPASEPVTESNWSECLPVHVPKDYSGGSVPAIPTGLTRCVAYVLVQTSAGEARSGTAFAITPGGCLVTCHHVVEGATEIYLTFDGEPKPRRAVTIASDEHFDVALIRLCDADGCQSWMKLAHPDKVASIGEEVALLGYPLGSTIGAEISYSQGIINSVRRVSKLPLYQSDCGAARGASGGPLFRRSDGAVLGVLGAGISGEGISMNINLAISIASFASLSWVRW